MELKLGSLPWGWLPSFLITVQLSNRLPLDLFRSGAVVVGCVLQKMQRTYLQCFKHMWTYIFPNWM